MLCVSDRIYLHVLILLSNVDGYFLLLGICYLTVGREGTWGGFFFFWSLSVWLLFIISGSFSSFCLFKVVFFFIIALYFLILPIYWNFCRCDSAAFSVHSCSSCLLGFVVVEVVFFFSFCF